jgi:hypothetical protein
MSDHRRGAGLIATGILVVSSALVAPLFAQGGRATGPLRPAPRLPDGTVNFGSTAQERGVWAAPDPRLIIAESLDETPTRDRNASPPPDDVPKPRRRDVPFQPWARELFLWRQQNEIEPYTRCKPAFGIRLLGTPYGTDITHVPEQKRIYVTVTGGPHTFRPIYIDGRLHPPDLDPSYYGHGVGRWEGDTLVVDTVGYTERSWSDRNGVVTTEQLHTVERLSRPDFNTLRYELTIDDPGAYTAPWTSTVILRWVPGAEQFEFVCQDGNLAPLLSIGSDNVPIDRQSVIVP